MTRSQFSVVRIVGLLVLLALTVAVITEAKHRTGILLASAKAVALGGHGGAALSPAGLGEDGLRLSANDTVSLFIGQQMAFTPVADSVSYLSARSLTAIGQVTQSAGGVGIMAVTSGSIDFVILTADNEETIVAQFTVEDTAALAGAGAGALVKLAARGAWEADGESTAISGTVTIEVRADGSHQLVAADMAVE